MLLFLVVTAVELEHTASLALVFPIHPPVLPCVESREAFPSSCDLARNSIRCTICVGMWNTECIISSMLHVATKVT